MILNYGNNLLNFNNRIIDFTSPVNDVIYNALSSSGKTAYSAATINNYVAVSQTDYNNVFTALQSATKYGMTDVQLTENGSTWAAGCTNLLPSGVTEVAAGTYLIGYVCNITGSGSVRPLVSYSPRGNYSGITANINVTGSGYRYFIRKAPTTPQPLISYVGQTSTASSLRLGTTNYPNSAYNCDGITPPWTIWNSAMALFQMYGTSIKQWQ
jgi:hypothetical protein